MSFAVLACVGTAGTANAQWGKQTTLDVGATRLTRDDFADTDGVNVAGLWSRWNERISLVGSAAATRVRDGRSTGLALGSGSYSVPIDRFRIEGGATATILGTTDLAPSSSWTGFARAHVLGTGWGAWVGGGGGGIRLEHTSFPAGTGEVGGWYRRGDHRVTLSAVRVATSSVSTTIFGDGTVLRITDPVRYADVSLIGHTAWRRFELDALGVTRHASRGNLASTPAGALAVTWWATPRVAIAAALGKQLADPLRGTVRARYATIALRFSAERHGPVAPLRVPPTVPAGAASLVVARVEDGQVVLRVQAPGAQRVELMGDVTDWEPRALERRAGWWEVRLTAAPGSHHVVVRMDGRAWMAPVNLPRLDDELGGTVGLIVVP